MAIDVEVGELYRLSIDDYHRLCDAGIEFPHVELLDGLLVRKDMKSREHENAIAWLIPWLVLNVDRDRFEVRVGAALTLESSEPEPDLTVIPRTAPRPYHPATADLAVEVSYTSLRRDLGRKRALYAQAGVGEYWVFDVDGRRLVVHRAPRDGDYTDVREVRAGGRVADPPAGLPGLELDELLSAAHG